MRTTDNDYYSLWRGRANAGLDTLSNRYLPPAGKPTTTAIDETTPRVQNTKKDLPMGETEEDLRQPDNGVIGVDGECVHQLFRHFVLVCLWKYQGKKP
jgi:hypothetical protein